MIILDLFDEFHFRNDKGAKTEDKCCQNQDFLNNSWMNVSFPQVYSNILKMTKKAQKMYLEKQEVN